MFTLSVRAAGGEASFDPTLRFEHDCETMDADGGRIQPMWKLYFLYRNQLMMYRQAAGDILFWPALLLVLPRWWLNGRRYGADRPIYRRLLRQAVSDGLRQRTDRGLAEARALAAPD